MIQKNPPDRIALILGNRFPSGFSESVSIYTTDVNVDDSEEADEFGVYLRDNNENQEGAICVIEPSGEVHGFFYIWQVVKDNTK